MKKRRYETGAKQSRYRLNWLFRATLSHLEFIMPDAFDDKESRIRNQPGPRTRRAFHPHVVHRHPGLPQELRHHHRRARKRALRRTFFSMVAAIEGFARIEESDMFAHPRSPTTFCVLPWRPQDGGRRRPNVLRHQGPRRQPPTRATRASCSGAPSRVRRRRDSRFTRAWSMNTTTSNPPNRRSKRSTREGISTSLLWTSQAT